MARVGRLAYAMIRVTEGRGIVELCVGLVTLFFSGIGSEATQK